MGVLRIVPNIEAQSPRDATSFYGDVLGLEVAMDLGWIVTFGSMQVRAAQISVAQEGGSGTPVPDLSIEVDDFDAVLARAQAAGVPVVYGPADEPWGVRRAFFRDPFGRLINVLTHA